MKTGRFWNVGHKRGLIPEGSEHTKPVFGFMSEFPISMAQRSRMETRQTGSLRSEFFRVSIALRALFVLVLRGIRRACERRREQKSENCVWGPQGSTLEHSGPHSVHGPAWKILSQRLTRKKNKTKHCLQQVHEIHTLRVHQAFNDPNEKLPFGTTWLVKHRLFSSKGQVSNFAWKVFFVMKSQFICRGKQDKLSTFPDEC